MTELKTLSHELYLDELSASLGLDEEDEIIDMQIEFDKIANRVVISVRVKEGKRCAE